ncbi:hypothetical protein N7504_011990 [Penicillium tannophilum]|nr:hypothetical protein N7504_011990 [Penicillium tannophilum]
MSEERDRERDSSKEAPSTPHREKSTEEGDIQEPKQKEDITSSKYRHPLSTPIADEFDLTSYKIHSKHLLPDTLNAYQLPWHWDGTDSQYLVIRRWFSEDLQNDLFRHTRNIRGERPGSPIGGFRTVSDTPGTEDDWIEGSETGRRREVQSPQLYREEDEDEDEDEEEEQEEEEEEEEEEEMEMFRRQVVTLPDSLSFDVNLRNPNVNRPVDEFRADPVQRKYATQRIDVASSQMPGYGKGVLYRSEPTVNVDAQFSWIHMNTEMRSFDDFMTQRFASNVPNLAAEDRALLVSLMKKSYSKAVGMNHPNDVMRCIGLDSTVKEGVTTEKCAILLRFPYFSIQKMETASQSRRRAKDKVRTLLQYYYNFESTRKRDQEQVIRKVGLFPEDHVVHVPQMWAVIVNFRFIITSAPTPLTDQGSSSLKIMDSPAQISSTPSVICVVDPLQRVFFFPIELCKTFLSLNTDFDMNLDMSLDMRVDLNVDASVDMNLDMNVNSIITRLGSSKNLSDPNKISNY